MLVSLKAILYRVVLGDIFTYIRLSLDYVDLGGS